jgi:hypothetical protein
VDDHDFCHCPDPADCDCGKPISRLGSADPSGRLLDRWVGCVICSQRGRIQLWWSLGLFLRWAAAVMIAFVVGAWWGGRR